MNISKKQYVFIFAMFILVKICECDASESNRTLRIGLGSNIVSLNPMKQLDLISASILSNIYDAPFYSKGIGFESEPMLVTAHKKINKNTWRLFLRKDVLFHNGEKFGAESFKCSLDYQRDENRSKWAGHLNFIKKVRIVDNYTVDVIVATPISKLDGVLRFGYSYIIPYEYYKSGGEQILSDYPVGTGPYIFYKRTKDSIVLKKNINYWRKEPYFDFIEYKFVPDENERINLLTRGELDVATSVNPHLGLKIFKTSRAKIVKIMTPRVVFMEVVNGIKPNRNKEGVLNDVLFRKALNYSIDRNSIVKYILLGNGKPAFSIVSPLFKEFESSIGYDYDPVKSKSLLKESSYLSDQTINVLTPSNRYPMDYQVAKTVAYYFKKIGIKVNFFQYNDWQEYQNVLHGGSDMQSFISLLGFGVIDFKTLLDFYFGREWERNRFLDSELMTSVQHLDEIIDPDELILEERRIAKIITDKAYVIPLFNVVNIYGVRKGIEIIPRNDEILNAENIIEWSK